MAQGILAAVPSELCRRDDEVVVADLLDSEATVANAVDPVGDLDQSEAIVPDRQQRSTGGAEADGDRRDVAGRERLPIDDSSIEQGGGEVGMEPFDEPPEVARIRSGVRPPRGVDRIVESGERGAVGGEFGNPLTRGVEIACLVQIRSGNQSGGCVDLPDGGVSVVDDGALDRGAAIGDRAREERRLDEADLLDEEVEVRDQLVQLAIPLDDFSKPVGVESPGGDGRPR